MLRGLHMTALRAALFDHSFHSLCGAGRYGATPHAPVNFGVLRNGWKVVKLLIYEILFFQYPNEQKKMYLRSSSSHPSSGCLEKKIQNPIWDFRFVL